MTGYIRYRGFGGVEAFAIRMAREAGVLVLPASIWPSTLSDLPTDRFRIGFGRITCPAGFDALRDALRSPARNAA